MNSFSARLTQALGLKVPLIVAPMAGGPSSVDLVVGASEAGALGSIGAAYLPAKAIHEFTKDVRSKTQQPFAINLFIPSHIPRVSDAQLNLAIHTTQKFRDEFGLSAPKLTPPYEEDFDQQFEAVLALKPKVLSFVFGVLSEDHLKEARKRGLITIGTATDADELYELQESGVDAVVAQGVEAGGHRGVFDSTASDPDIGLRDLVRDIKRKAKIPVIAAGGIMSADDIKSALHAGADAVQMGTAFLATSEAGTSAPYRAKLLESETRTTKLTRAFSGRLARGIINRFMEEMEAEPEAILPFPQQNKFTRDLRAASTAAGSADAISLWCGTGRGELWTGSVKDLIGTLFTDSR